MRRFWIFAGACSLAWALLAVSAKAVDVRVTIQNLSPEGSVALSPFFVAAHNGSFDAFNAGAAAGTGTEDVAELGNGAALAAELAAVQPSAVSDTLIATTGGFGPGIFRPGASGSIVLSLDPTIHRFFSFGAMVVPSNDAFVGNDSPTSIELFNGSGDFVASNLVLTGSQVWDAGTEVNQLLGAAYVVGQTATDGVAEGGVVHSVDLATEFAAFVNEMTPAGETFLSAPGATVPLASISFEIVPEPASWLLGAMGLAGFVALVRRRRTRR